jgi:hypothetical protein
MFESPADPGALVHQNENQQCFVHGKTQGKTNQQRLVTALKANA